MNGRFLLDTNVLVAILNRDTRVASRMSNGSLFGELHYGSASQAGQPRTRSASIDLRRSGRFECDAETAKHYGLIKDGLRRADRPIPENDIWIAAIAMQHDLTLVTRDAHFDAVADLKIARW